MKTKTIKDLENQDWSTNKNDYKLVKAVFFDLKQLAISRIKNYLNELKGYVELSEIGADSECVWKWIDNDDEANSYGITCKIEELVEVFNITLEDLK